MAATIEVPVSRQVRMPHQWLLSLIAVGWALAIVVMALVMCSALARGPAPAPGGHRTGAPIVVPSPAPGPFGS